MTSVGASRLANGAGFQPTGPCASEIAP